MKELAGYELGILFDVSQAKNNFIGIVSATVPPFSCEDHSWKPGYVLRWVDEVSLDDWDLTKTKL